VLLKEDVLMKKIPFAFVMFVSLFQSVWCSAPASEKPLNTKQLPTDIQAHINSMMGYGDAVTAPNKTNPARMALLHKELFKKPMTLPLEKLEAYVEEAEKNGVRVVGPVTINLATEMQKISKKNPNPLSMGLTQVLQKCVGVEDKVSAFVFNEGEALHNRAELLRRMFRTTDNISIIVSKQRMENLATAYHQAFATANRNKPLEEPPILADI
jgi:hypothetical protein